MSYSPSVAQRRADRRLARPKLSKLAADERLRLEVARRLRIWQSPQQIMQRLRMDFPDDQAMRVSHETIYRRLYVQGRGELRRELTAYVRSGRAVRKPHARGTGPPGMAGRADPRHGHDQRTPAEVEDRAVPGHWEGDLIMGKQSKSAIGTLVERTTRYVMLLHLPDGNAPQPSRNAMISAIVTLPEHCDAR